MLTPRTVTVSPERRGHVSLTNLISIAILAQATFALADRAHRPLAEGPSMVEEVAATLMSVNTIIFTTLAIVAGIAFWLGRASASASSKASPPAPQPEEPQPPPAPQPEEPQPPPAPQQGHRRREPIFTCRSGTRYHVVRDCRTIPRESAVTEWEACRVCGI